MNVRERTGVDGFVKRIAISQPSTAIASHVVTVKYCDVDGATLGKHPPSMPCRVEPK
jgi:hypothetical protein